MMDDLDVYCMRLKVTAIRETLNCWLNDPEFPQPSMDKLTTAIEDVASAEVALDALETHLGIRPDDGLSPDMRRRGYR